MTVMEALKSKKAKATEHFDVLIVGAGISGVGGAYHLGKQCPDTSYVVRTALAVSSAMHVVSPLVTSSTDANIAMSLGIPALMLPAGGSSHGEHSLQEWYDDGVDGFKGPQWVLLLVLSLVGVR